MLYIEPGSLVRIPSNVHMIGKTRDSVGQEYTSKVKTTSVPTFGVLLGEIDDERHIVFLEEEYWIVEDKNIHGVD